MSKTFVKPGDVLELTAPYNVVSGGGFLVGAVFAVAQGTATSGAAVEGRVTGVHDLPKVTSAVISQGAAVYWDDTNKQVVTTSSSGIKIGACETTVSSGGTTVRTRLNGAF